MRHSTGHYHVVIMLPISGHRNSEEGKEGEMRKITCSSLITPALCKYLVLIPNYQTVKSDCDRYACTTVKQ